MNAFDRFCEARRTRHCTKRLRWARRLCLSSTLFSGALHNLFASSLYCRNHIAIECRCSAHQMWREREAREREARDAVRRGHASRAHRNRRASRRGLRTEKPRAPRAAASTGRLWALTSSSFLFCLLLRITRTTVLRRYCTRILSYSYLAFLSFGFVRVHIRIRVITVWESVSLSTGVVSALDFPFFILCKCTKTKIRLSIFVFKL